MVNIKTYAFALNVNQEIDIGNNKLKDRGKIKDIRVVRHTHSDIPVL